MADALLTTFCCRSCKLDKASSEFYSRLNRHGNPSRDTMCKECRSTKVQAARHKAITDPGEAERRRLWRKEHKRKLRREAGCKTLAEKAQARIEREAQLAAERAVRAERKLEPDAHVRRWREMAAVRARYHKYTKDPAYVLNGRMRNAIKKAIKGDKAGRSWESLVGYTLDQLKIHIEKQFQRGMSWANMGEWHIDHIIPKSLFKYQSAECPEFKAAWALTNLQPLWAGDNKAKGDERTLLL